MSLPYARHGHFSTSQTDDVIINLQGMLGARFHRKRFLLFGPVF